MGKQREKKILVVSIFSTPLPLMRRHMTTLWRGHFRRPVTHCCGSPKNSPPPPTPSNSKYHYFKLSIFGIILQVICSLSNLGLAFRFNVVLLKSFGYILFTFVSNFKCIIVRLLEIYVAYPHKRCTTSKKIIPPCCK